MLNQDPKGLLAEELFDKVILRHASNSGNQSGELQLFRSEYRKICSGGTGITPNQYLIKQLDHWLESMSAP